MRSIALSIVMLALTIKIMKSDATTETLEHDRALRGLTMIVLIVCLIMGW